MALTVRQHIARVAREFKKAKLYFGHGTVDAADEAAWLVGHALNLLPSALDRHLNDRPTPPQEKDIRTLARERIRTRRPLAYLLFEAWFAGLKFYVDERVIVPRSLVGEFILDRFEPWVRAKNIKNALDLCTGSGAIAIALARAFPGSKVDATDISKEALAVARINVVKHKLKNRVRLIRADLFRGVPKKRYDLIVTNPPYVAQREMKTLPKEYRHEPQLALESGKSGVVAITSILANASHYLKDDGVFVAEVGNSAPVLQATFPTVPFMWLTTSTGDESVFMLTAMELKKHAAVFAKKMSYPV